LIINNLFYNIYLLWNFR